MTSLSRLNSISQSTSQLRRLSQDRAVTTSYAHRGSAIENEEARREEMLKKGFEQGYAEGLARAEVEAQIYRDAEFRRAAKALDALVEAIKESRTELEEVRSELEKAVPKFAYSLLQEMFVKELRLQENPGLEAIERALSLKVVIDHPAVVHLSPEDVNSLEKALDDLSYANIKVIPDDSVSSGGAIVEMGKTTIDAGLSSALERVRKVLLGDEEVELVP